MVEQVIDKPKMGRPLKYTDEKITALAKEVHKIADQCQKSGMMLHRHKVALQLGLYPEHFLQFADKNQDFSYAIKHLKAVQEINYHDCLVKKGCNTVGIIFAMKNCAGWRDHQDHNVTHNFVWTTIVQEADAIQS
uniref:Putative terminase small subunit n=1 Tax=viral metagenome TaxID=1070528 RepID=A0A6M3X9E1_9ZZZZ